MIDNNNMEYNDYLDQQFEGWLESKQKEQEEIEFIMQYLTEHDSFYIDSSRRIH